MGLRSEIDECLDAHGVGEPRTLLVGELLVIADRHAYRATAPYDASTPSASATVSEETDLDRWLEVWEQLDIATAAREADEGLDYLLAAVRNLMRLIQPPSTRVARQINADEAAASRT